MTKQQKKMEWELHLNLAHAYIAIPQYSYIMTEIPEKPRKYAIEQTVSDQNVFEFEEIEVPELSVPPIIKSDRNFSSSKFKSLMPPTRAKLASEFPALRSLWIEEEPRVWNKLTCLICSKSLVSSIFWRHLKADKAIKC